jgi:hypothetical protein
MAASRDRQAFLYANHASPIVECRYRDKPIGGRFYRLKNGKTFILTGQQCVGIIERWPEDFSFL